MPAVITKPSLTIRRRFKAPPEKVYDAWTDPVQIMRWFAPHGSKVLEATFDPRVGGHYMIRAVSPSGEHHEVSGVVREALPNRRLVYTWGWRSMPERESLVTVEFRPDGEGTLLQLTHEQFFDEDARDRHNSGWNSVLDSLERHLD